MIPALQRAWPFIKAASLIALGFVAGWGLYHPRLAPYQGHADAIRQADGSLIAQRDTVTAREAAKLPNAPQLPKGAKLERAISATIQLHSLPGLPKDAPLPQVHIDASLVKMSDGGERVVIKSPDGDVVSATDLVVAPPRGLSAERGWGVGGFWNPSTRAWGPIITKDLGPFRLGAMGRIERTQVLTGLRSNNSVDLIIAIHF